MDERIVLWNGNAEPECGCCDINDYYALEPYGSCENCGHSPEEHYA